MILARMGGGRAEVDRSSQTGRGERVGQESVRSSSPDSLSVKKECIQAKKFEVIDFQSHIYGNNRFKL